ncbi:hypothetical protein D3C81_1284240 [compost metagenome]
MTAPIPAPVKRLSREAGRSPPENSQPNRPLPPRKNSIANPAKVRISQYSRRNTTANRISGKSRTAMISVYRTCSHRASSRSGSGKVDSQTCTFGDTHIVSGTATAIPTSDNTPPLSSANRRPAEREAPRTNPCNTEPSNTTNSSTVIQLYSLKGCSNVVMSSFMSSSVHSGCLFVFFIGNYVWLPG